MDEDYRDDYIEELSDRIESVRKELIETTKDYNSLLSKAILLESHLKKYIDEYDKLKAETEGLRNIIGLSLDPKFRQN